MKTKPCFILLLSLLCQGWRAQDSLIKRRVYLGLTVSSYYEKTFTGEPAFSLYQPRQLAPLRYGVDLKVKITPRFSLGAGLVVDIRGQVLNMNLSQSTSVGEVVKITQVSKNISIGLPVRADFRFTRNRFSAFVTAGWFSSMYVQQSIHTIVNYDGGYHMSQFQKYKRSGDERQLLLLMQVGAGLDVELKRFKLQLFPLYEGGTDWFYVRTLNQTIYQHRIGGMLSVYYNL
jgi:hypothetical protein